MAYSVTRGTIRERTLIAILLAAITIDTILSNIADLLVPTVSTNIRIVIFSIIAILAIITGIRICVDQTNRVYDYGILPSSVIQTSKAMRTIQYILSGLLGIILVEAAIFMQYHTIPLLGVMLLGYFTGAGFLALLSYKFIQWFHVNPKVNWILLFFLMSSVMMSMILFMTIFAQSILLFDRFPEVVTSKSVLQFPSLEGLPSDPIQVLLAIPYFMTPLWGFFIWIGSTLMLKSYSRSIGRPLFWILIIGSLTSIILGSVIVFTPNTSGPFDISLVGFRLIGIAAIIGQGYLLGFAFLRISRNTEGKVAAKIKKFLHISAFGISLLYAAVSANLAFGAFPPFGAVSYSFVAIGGYLFVLGIYSSAISVTTDLGIRKIMHNYLVDKSGFIDMIGKANTDIELRKTVISLSKTYIESMNDKAEFEYAMSDLEYQEYLDEALKEIHKKKEYNDSEQ